ncbi:MAG TPA: formylmethanofuran dehydrogenase [Acidiferrobacteraceae bacterium]|nr:formylmethanofuran dehydrogenase [Acidiferrobacteraceae bacterium]HEX20715.1 formylmethanofuran dehydrogenase [Acidiferrobacteraceae bacterium]
MNITLQEYFNTGIKFHGHKCPAMPMGLRAGLAAMKKLGVERAKNKELIVHSETGKGHAAGCFLDGIMTATGCTYGKSNIEKLYYNKMAFTLIDVIGNRSVRVSLKPDFFEGVLSSPFVQQRAKGVEPQDIPAEIVDPLVDKILNLSDEQFLEMGEIQTIDAPKGKGTFKTRRCTQCGEVTFVNKLRVTETGDYVCIPCSGWGG